MAETGAKRIAVVDRALRELRDSYTLKQSLERNVKQRVDEGNWKAVTNTSIQINGLLKQIEKLKQFIAEQYA
jgi:hypothetical protein